VKLEDLLCIALRHSLSGLEFLYGVPGTVGGAARQNAGAFGHEAKDFIEEITFVSLDGTETLGAKDLRFSYRSLESKKDSFILSVTFSLTPLPREEIEAKKREIIKARRDKGQFDYPSLGSFFKNPEGDSAGRIIDSLGLKGLSVGDAAVSEKHANIIVNKGHASAEDVIALSEKIKRDVQEKAGIELSEEVAIL